MLVKKITLEWLKNKNACAEGIAWWKNQTKTDSLEVLRALIEENRLDWANWLIVLFMDRAQYISYAIYAAEQVLNIFESRFPNDKRPGQAIEAARAVLRNDTKETRAAARAAARATWAAARAAWEAARAAARAARAAARAARAAARAAGDAAWAAGEAARAAGDAAWAAGAAGDAGDAARAAWEATRATWDAAWAAGEAARDNMFLKIIKHGISLLEKEHVHAL